MSGNANFPFNKTFVVNSGLVFLKVSVKHIRGCSQKSSWHLYGEFHPPPYSVSPNISLSNFVLIEADFGEKGFYLNAASIREFNSNFSPHRFKRDNENF
jgi:hypothetical protein